MKLYFGKGEIQSVNQIRTTISLNTSTKRWFKDKGANISLTLRTLLRHVVMRYNDGYLDRDGITDMFKEDIKGDKDLLFIRINKDHLIFLREKLGIYNLSLVSRIFLKRYMDLFDKEREEREEREEIDKELLDKIL